MKNYQILVSKDGGTLCKTDISSNRGITRSVYRHLRGRLPIDEGFTLNVIESEVIEKDVTSEFMRETK